jgi:hypothetical protein
VVRNFLAGRGSEVLSSYLFLAVVCYAAFVFYPQKFHWIKKNDAI